MAFFATVLLSFLFIQDTRKSTYELLHTKPVTAVSYTHLDVYKRQSEQF